MNGAPMNGASARLLATLALALGLVLLTLGRAHLSADIADFLPRGESEGARFMLDQVRRGPAASLLLFGIEGAPAADRAAISRDFAARLRASGQFRLVQNGAGLAGGEEQDFLFRHRYPLSPATSADAFTEAALHADFSALLTALASSAAPLATEFGLADPTGAFPALLALWAGPSQVREIGGVWFAPERDRALLIARTRASGVDLAGQHAAAQAVAAAFRASERGNARLLEGGPAVFALAAEHAIRGDAETISVLSGLLVLAILAAWLKNPLALAAVLIPVLFATAAALALTTLVFGRVHALTFGFGMTMLGVSLDYPVLWIGHRRPGEPVAATSARIGRTLAVTVAGAGAGLAGMAASAFPGLAELGLFAASGIVAAALATRLILAPLLVAAAIAPAERAAPWLDRLEGLRRYRAWTIVPIALAGVSLLAAPPPLTRDLRELSPVPQAAGDLDGALRAELGAPEVALLAWLQGPDAEAVLAREEALLSRLDALVAQGALSGASLAARLLPSAATQTARQRALPAPDLLAERVALAASGLGFRPDAFKPFLDDAAAARQDPPLTLAAITPPLLAARLAPLLFVHDGRWFGVIAPSGLADAAAFRAAFADAPDVHVLDIPAEMTALVATYTGAAWRWLGLGAGCALVALIVGLGGVRPLPRVLAPLAGAVVVTLALLGRMGEPLSLFHIVALPLMVGIGLDYALFFARRQRDGDERARTFRTLVLCHVMTLATFGLLVFCRTPLLRGIGLTVAIGVAAAMVFSFFLAGRPPLRSAPACHHRSPAPDR